MHLGLFQGFVRWSCWLRVDDISFLCFRLLQRRVLRLLAPREQAAKNWYQAEQDHDPARGNASPDTHLEFHHLGQISGLLRTNKTVWHKTV